MRTMIYILEDDASIRKLVVYTLNSQGMEAEGFERPSLLLARPGGEEARAGAAGHHAARGGRPAGAETAAGRSQLPGSCRS